MNIEKAVSQMALLRLIFGLMSLTAAFLMIKFNDVKIALKINGILGSIGPFVFLTVSGIGILNLKDEIPFIKITIIVIGIGLIMIGTK
ncbi:MAG: hypothetical protein PWP21_162 [Thermosediminibacterales bacterium]|nr:hypothetical protein [Thermosediminibacterales bacterium]